MHKEINLEWYKPGTAFSEENVKSLIISIWEHIESNYDLIVTKVLIIGSDTQFYINNNLNNVQCKELKKNFELITDIENYEEFDLISLYV